MRLKAGGPGVGRERRDKTPLDARLHARGHGAPELGSDIAALTLFPSEAQGA